MNYHITENGPKLCKDQTGRCPYAKEGGAHYADLGQAAAAYSDTLKKEFGAFSSFKNSSNNVASVQGRFSQQENKVSRDSRTYSNVIIAKTFKGGASVLSSRVASSEVKKFAQVARQFS